MGVGAEAVDGDVQELFVHPQGDAGALAVIHVEGGAGVLAQIEALRQGAAGFFQHGEVADAVHPVVAVVADGGIVGHQIVVPVHAQRHRVGDVGGAALAVGLFTADRPVEVAEGDLLILVDGGVDAVHGVVECFVDGAQAVHHVHLPPQLPRAVMAGELLQFGDQLHALFLGQEGGGLHHVDEQLQLRQLELPVA